MEKLDSLYREAWERDFYQFCGAAWRVLEPSRPWRPTWYRHAVAEHLQAAIDGRFKRVLIMVPPQSGKSSIVTKLFPVWAWLKHPSLRFLFSSYSFEALAVPMSIERRRLIESPWFRQFWGDKIKLSPDDNLKWRYSNHAGGYHAVVTAATGLGGDVLLVDDLHSADQARSDAEREAAIEHFRSALMSRLTPGGRDICIVVCQRLHELDLAGTLMREGGWKQLCLPAICDRPEAQKVHFPLRQKYIIRKIGSRLDPETMDEQFLALRKIELGPAGFSSQYQQSPAPAEGIIFNPAWWRRYKDAPHFEMIVVSVDAAFKDNRDAVAVQVWGFEGPRCYLVTKTTRQMGYLQTKDTIRMYVRQYHANVVLIEQAANGAAIVEELSREFAAIGIPPLGSKEARAQACAPTIAAELGYLPEGPMGDQMATDAAKFPLGANDHDIDAMSLALNWRRQNTFGLIEYYKQMAANPPAERTAEEKAQRQAFEKSAHIKFSRPDGAFPACHACGRSGTETEHRQSVTVVNGRTEIGEERIVRCSHCKAIQNQKESALTQ